MEYTVKKHANVAGTSFKGYVNDGITYHDLVNIFGYPVLGSGDNKVAASWDGTINDEVFTIYNYKSGINYLGEEGTPVEEMVGDDWHIGGLHSDVVDMINDYISQDLEYKPSELIFGPDYNVFWFSFDDDSTGDVNLKLLHTYIQTPIFDKEEDAWDWVEQNKEDIIKALPGDLRVEIAVLKTKGL